ncbi:MAG TPA: patatin-like phospholipase family protein [Candidatus Corynebacterium faecigallinarum]|uniref:Patatin-like phospholipase family protein n=1 Tax=Candidatus Corynebacterium faecigallinarum TaxID=2838528 RepID=A0A9D2QF77_9CORY|nr:patatin-like phospholipase family protein [Candidatus Corynebacterium faecigallinarum]
MTDTTASPVSAADVALVCEGGGARNSFTAATVHEFMASGVRFGWIGGVSAGASHTVNYLGHGLDRTRESFVEFTASPASGGVGSFIRGDGYFDAEYIYETSGLPGSDLPYDFDAFLADPTPFRIEATNALTGESVRWGREDITDRESLFKRVRASSTLPVIMNTPEVDGIPYVDGALSGSGGIPVDAAEDDGFERFIVLCTRPRDYVRPQVKYPAAIRRLLARHPAVAEAVLGRPDLYNATKRRLFELEKQGRALLFFPEQMRISNTERNLDKLKASYYDGMVQTSRDWDRMMEFISD